VVLSTVVPTGLADWDHPMRHERARRQSLLVWGSSTGGRQCASRPVHWLRTGPGELWHISVDLPWWSAATHRTPPTLWGPRGPCWLPVALHRRHTQLW